MNAFEKWAKAKGMLIDRDETGAYKSLETRAYADTWKHANADLLAALENELHIIEKAMQYKEKGTHDYIWLGGIVNRLREAIRKTTA